MRPSGLVRVVIILAFVAVIGTPLFYLRQGVYAYVFTKEEFFEAVVKVLVGLWIALAITDRRYLPAIGFGRWQAGRPRWTPVTVGMAAFAGFLVLSALWGIDPWRSFWSTQERSLGVIGVLHLLALALALASLGSAVPWKRLWYASLTTAAVTGILALIQLRVPNLLLGENVGSRAGATFGNPTFLAGYLLFHVFIGFYFLVEARPDRGRGGRLGEILFLAATIGLNLVALFVATNTRGDLVGLGAGLLVLLALFAVRPPELPARFLRSRRAYLAALIAIVVAGSVFWLTRSAPLWRSVPGLARFQDVSLSSEGLQPRLVALRAAWRGFLDRPAGGWGWDNFNIVFNRYYDPRALETSYQETRFDKPHNFVLEDLVAGGVPLLLARFFLLTAIAVEAFRLRDRLRGPVVAAALCAYVFRNLFAFDTIGPLLALALVAAWVDGAYREERGAAAGAAAHVTRQAPSGARAAAWFAVGAALVAAYVLNIRPLEATVDQYWGFQYFAAGKPDLAVASFKRAVGAATPYRWNFARDYATAVAEAHFYNPRLVAPEDVRDALAAMETVAAEHPWDAYNHYALVDLYNQTSDLDPPNHAAAAEREAAIALRLSPQRQEVYFSLAKTKSLEGDNAAALELLDEALELDPKVADAHFYYGLIAFVGHDAERGYSEIKQAIALGRAWKNSDEPRVVANFFADASHLDEAIDLYRRALGIRPTDQEAKIKLGIAYFLKGDRANARRYIEEVARDVDLTKSPSYGELEPVLRELGITP